MGLGLIYEDKETHFIDESGTICHNDSSTGGRGSARAAASTGFPTKWFRFQYISQFENKTVQSEFHHPDSTLLIAKT